MGPRPSRRALLASGAAAAGVGLAGCPRLLPPSRPDAVRWTYPSGGRPYRPIADDGIVYGSSHGAGVYALALDDGTERWMRPFAERYVSAVRRGGDGLYVTSRETDGPPLLRAMTGGGESRWRFEPPREERLHLYGLADGTALVVQQFSDDRSTALRGVGRAAGDERWRETADAPLFADDVAVGTDRVYVLDESLRALDAADGRGLWRVDGGGGDVVRHRGTVYALGDALAAYDAATGDRRWRFDRDVPPQAVTPAADAAYLVDGSGVLYALDAADGSVRWEVDAAPKNAPTVAGEVLFVDAADGLVALAADDGAERWRFPTAAPPRSVPGADAVFVVSGDPKQLHAVDRSDGTERWTAAPPDGFDLLGVAGDVAFVGHGDELLALDGSG